MANFPNRCQHIKVNGTQCGSPALRRNRFCYFHKRFHDERIQIGTERARSRRGSFELPLLEDANSIQVSLMQVMRLLATGQIDGKTAGLFLYALQTASANLRKTNFEPYMYDIVLDPRNVDETPLRGKIWQDADFEDEEEEEDDEESQQTKKASTPAAAEGNVRPSEVRNPRNPGLKTRIIPERYSVDWPETPSAMQRLANLIGGPRPPAENNLNSSNGKKLEDQTDSS